jgi:hypothetical protein
MSARLFGAEIPEPPRPARSGDSGSETDAEPDPEVNDALFDELTTLYHLEGALTYHHDYLFPKRLRASGRC